MDELIARLEAATGPDRELDAAILLVVRPGAKLRARVPYEFEFKGGYFNVPFYTASIDAALTLVPEGWAWQLRGRHCYMEKGGISLYWYEGGEDAYSNGHGATPALAICIAALRAHNNG